MVRVKVRVYAKLREELGFRERVFEADTISDLLETLGVNAASVVVAVNGELVETSKSPEFRLVDGDTVDVMPPFSGG